MENSFLYDLLYDRYCDYREELDKKKNFFTERIDALQKKLDDTLDKEQLELLDDYKSSIIYWREGIEIEFGIKLVNVAVNIGLQLQKSFDGDEIL